MTDPDPDPAAASTETKLAEAVARANHFERLLAAIVSTSGPVQVTQAAYETADPEALMSHTGTVGGVPVVMFTLPDHATLVLRGLVGELAQLDDTAPADTSEVDRG